MLQSAFNEHRYDILSNEIHSILKLGDMARES
jgi:hypothetical protein